MTKSQIFGLLFLGFIAWIGFTSFRQVGTNIGNSAVEATSPEFARAQDGLPIVDGSRQRQPYPIAKGAEATFYVVGKVAVRNFADYCLNNSNPEAFDRTYSSDGRVYYIEPCPGKMAIVTMTSKHKSQCSVQPKHMSICS